MTPDTRSRVDRVTAVAAPGWRWADFVRMVAGPSYYVEASLQDLALHVALGTVEALARTARLATLPGVCPPRDPVVAVTDIGPPRPPYPGRTA